MLFCSIFSNKISLQKGSSMNLFAILILTFISLFTNQLNAALPEYTQILTPHGYKEIQSLVSGDQVCSFDVTTQKKTTATVVTVQACNPSSFCLVKTNNGLVAASSSQQFFDTTKNQWICAEQLNPEVSIFNLSKQKAIVNCCATIEYVSPDSTWYKLSLSAPHTFFITEHNILTHNVLPLAIGISFVFGESLASLAFSGVSLALGALIFGTKKDNKPFIAIKGSNDDPFEFAHFNDHNELNNENNKRHILQEKHNWKKLDPDPNNNWDKIIQIIRRVLKEGVHSFHSKANDGKDVYNAKATINNHTVGVRYKLDNNVKIISTAWVQ